MIYAKHFTVFDTAVNLTNLAFTWSGGFSSPISDAHVPLHSVTIKNVTTGTDSVYIGDEVNGPTPLDTYGYAIGPGEVVTLQLRASQLYVIGTSAGVNINYLAITE